MPNKHHFVGKCGITESRMKLTGFISIDGQRYEAISKYFLPINIPVRVTGTSFHLLMVEPTTIYHQVL